MQAADVSGVGAAFRHVLLPIGSGVPSRVHISRIQTLTDELNFQHAVSAHAPEAGGQLSYTEALRWSSRRRKGSREAR
jgi:hypothetical protein